MHARGSMYKILTILSLFSGLASAVSFSLGVLTPEMVRKLGQSLGNYTFSKPSSAIFEAAYTKVIHPTAEKSLQGWLNTCFTQLAVEILTVVIAVFLSLILLLSLSIWGLVDAAKTGSHRIQWASRSSVFSCALVACATSSGWAWGPASPVEPWANCSEARGRSCNL